MLFKLESISASQLSRRLPTLPKNSPDELLAELARHIGRANLIDSSMVTLASTRYPWARFRKTKRGINLHLELDFFQKMLSKFDEYCC